MSEPRRRLAAPALPQPAMHATARKDRTTQHGEQVGPRGGREWRVGEGEPEASTQPWRHCAELRAEDGGVSAAAV